MAYSDSDVDYTLILQELEYERASKIIDESEYQETKASLEQEYQQKVNEAISFSC